MNLFSLSETTAASLTFCSLTADAGILQVMWQRKRWKRFRFFLPGCVLSIVFSLIVRIQRKALKTILQAIDYVKNGISICIFPEGTRNKGEELSLLPFKEGAFKIATKTGCPIVPISMNNTAEIFENHFPKIKKTHVVLEYGTPIYPNELDKDVKKHIGSYVENIVNETIHKNAELLKN